MGNCQAIDAASLVIQHPNGRVERLYWPVTANEVMKSNPGHYVALIITTCLSQQGDKPPPPPPGVGNVRVTRVKLLKPADILGLGQAYRLIDSQEVMKGLWAKKYAKMKKNEQQTTEMPPQSTTRIHSHHHPVCPESEKHQVVAAGAQERQKQRPTPPSTSVRPKQWRPSLQSISEAGLQKTTQPQPQPPQSRQQSAHAGYYQRKEVFSQSSC